MVLQHGVIIHLVDMVTGQNQHMLRIKLIHKFQIAVNRVCRPPVPAATVLPFMRRQYEYPAILAVQVPIAAYPNVRMQHKRLILRQHAHGINPGIGAIAQREINNPVGSPKINSGLGKRFRQPLQPFPLASR
ncbi:hypothetical protein D3C73_1117050 [compost metagenome]